MEKLYENTLNFDMTDNAAEYAQKVEANEMNAFASVYKGLINLGVDSVGLQRRASLA